MASAAVYSAAPIVAEPLQCSVALAHQGLRYVYSAQGQTGADSETICEVPEVRYIAALA